MSADEGSPFSPEQLQYWTAHKTDTLVLNIIACVVVTGVLSTLFLVLRISGRRILNGRFRLHLSHWLTLVAYVFFILLIVCFAMLTPYGGGRHIIFITNPYKLQVKSITSEAAYGVAMDFLKFSILSLYGAIFPSQTFRRYLWLVAIFILGWTLTAALGAVLQCIPIAKAYEGSLKDYCIHYGRLTLVVGIFNVVTDFVLIAMPIPLVLKLQATAKRKRVLIATFYLGCSAVIVSVVHLVYSLDVGSIDGSWAAIPAGYTSAVELTVGFFVVSIPVYRGFYKKVIKRENVGATGWSYRSMGAPLRHNRSAASPYVSKDGTTGHSNASSGYKGSFGMQREAEHEMT